MKRKAMDRLVRWKGDGAANAVLVTGARQVGKTYLLKEFARTCYGHCVYINFEDTPSLKSIFSYGRDAGTVISMLRDSGFDGDMVPGDTLIVFDEIQSCPDAYAALKPLAIDGTFDIAASGSLLGVDLSNEVLSPMGYVDLVEMHPMDFEEFLWAMGMSERFTERVGGCIRGKRPLSEADLSRATELFRRYLVVGGMPAAVRAYASTGEYSRAVDALNGVTVVMFRDAQKYSPMGDRLQIHSCIYSVPAQLGKENNTFSYTDIDGAKGKGRSYYGSAIAWLEAAGIVHVVFNVTEPTEPLLTNRREKSFKVYMYDTGMLVNMLGPHVAAGIANGDFHVNNGAIMENAVALALLWKGYRPYFFQKTNGSLEVDFVLNYRSALTAVEVKSGNYRRCRSLAEVMSDRYKMGAGIVIEDGNVYTDGSGVDHYPLFAASFFDECRAPDIPLPGFLGEPGGAD